MEDLCSRCRQLTTRTRLYELRRNFDVVSNRVIYNYDLGERKSDGTQEWIPIPDSGHDVSEEDAKLFHLVCHEDEERRCDDSNAIDISCPSLGDAVNHFIYEQFKVEGGAEFYRAWDERVMRETFSLSPEELDADLVKQTFPFQVGERTTDGHQLFCHYPLRVVAYSARTCRLCRFILESFDKTENVLCEGGDLVDTVLRDPKWSQYRRNFVLMRTYHSELQTRERGDDDDLPLDMFALFLVYIPDLSDPSSFRHGTMIFGGEREIFLEAAEGSYDWRRRNATAVMNKWLSECLETHDICNEMRLPPVKGSSALPKRLLEVRGSSRRLSIQLFETIELPNVEVEYATLSHCWGKHGISTRLSNKNYTQFREEIPIIELPRTFIEAAQVVVALKIKYLWIDALCIVQDSESDWLREAPRMATIYSNAILNIAATAATDGDDGLFPDKDDAHYWGRLMRFSWDQLSPRDRIWTLMKSKTAYEDLIELAPLNRRGWVYQERALSRRVIHFASDQMWWDCRESCFLEGGHEYDGSRRPPMEDILSFGWCGVALRYANLALTRQSDRLVAIAGLAERYALQEGYSHEDYKAGLWMSNFLDELMWYRDDQKEVLSAKNGSSQAEYVAPSWSWASLGVMIYYNPWESDIDLFKNQNFDILDVCVSLVSDNPLGPINDGFMELECLLHPAVFTGVHGSILSTGSLHIMDQQHTMDSSLIYSEWDEAPPRPTMRCKIYFDRPETGIRNRGFEGYFVPAALHAFGSDTEDEDATYLEGPDGIWGFLLVKVGGGEGEVTDVDDGSKSVNRRASRQVKNAFERIGLVWFSPSRSGWQKIPPWWSQPSLCPELGDEFRLEDGRYKIRIV